MHVSTVYAVVTAVPCRKYHLLFARMSRSTLNGLLTRKLLLHTDTPFTLLSTKTLTSRQFVAVGETHCHRQP
jgi:hypothetical protein